MSLFRNWKFWEKQKKKEALELMWKVLSILRTQRPNILLHWLRKALYCYYMWKRSWWKMMRTAARWTQGPCLYIRMTCTKYGVHSAIWWVTAESWHHDITDGKIHTPWLKRRSTLQWTGLGSVSFFKPWDLMHLSEYRAEASFSVKGYLVK